MSTFNEKGAPSRIRSWATRAHLEAGERLDLCAKGAAQLDRPIAFWEWGKDGTDDVEVWAEQVSEICTEDANNRGIRTTYELVVRRDHDDRRPTMAFEIRRRPRAASGEFDSTPDGIVQQMQQHTQVAMQTMVAATAQMGDAMAGVMQQQTHMMAEQRQFFQMVLGTLTTRNDELERRVADAYDARLESVETLVESRLLVADAEASIAALEDGNNGEPADVTQELKDEFARDMYALVKTYGIPKLMTSFGS